MPGPIRQTGARPCAPTAFTLAIPCLGSILGVPRLAQTRGLDAVFESVDQLFQIRRQLLMGRQGAFASLPQGLVRSGEDNTILGADVESVEVEPLEHLESLLEGWLAIGDVRLAHLVGLGVVPATVELKAMGSICLLE